MIPRRLIRTVPERTSNEVERFWSHARDLHLTWEHVTYRDPIQPNRFPLTRNAWQACRSGAQLAGLIRLEALWHHGGIYIDSDVQMFRPMDDLLHVDMFAAWEDEQTVPDAVLGAMRHHPAIGACIDLALERLGVDNATNGDWRTGPGAWSTGPGVTTTVLPVRADVNLLDPASFFGVHYSEKDQLDTFDPAAHPDAYGLHRWHASWL